MKAAYWYVRRAMQPRSLHLSDEGGNGLRVHLVNESPVSLVGHLRIALYQHGEVRVGEEETPVEVPSRNSIVVSATSLFSGFQDLNFAYRFGRPACDLLVASFHQGTEPPMQAFHFPTGLPSRQEHDLGLEAKAVMTENGDAWLRLQTRRLAQSVTIRVDGYEPDDNHLHVEPGRPRPIRLRSTPGRPHAQALLRGHVQALNSVTATKILMETEPTPSVDVEI